MRSFEQSGLFLFLLTVVGVASGVAAYRFRDLTLATGCAVVILYLLHLLRVRFLRSHYETMRIVERLEGELADGAASGTTVNRRLGLGTVALVEGAMEPEEICRSLRAERADAGTSFVGYARKKGYLDRAEITDLLEVQQKGRYLSDQLRAARHRVEEYHEKVEPGRR